MKRLFALCLLLSACSVVQSLNTATIEQTAANEVKVTTLTSGLLTIASTERITKLRGENILGCTLESTYKGEAHGVICRDVKRGFVVSLETIGTVAARVTQTPDSRAGEELETTARRLESE